MAFGPDGFLYIAVGDGGSGGDPMGNGQNRQTLLGKILRIDVDHADAGLQYAIPPDNPFVGSSDRGEIWAYGFRNPWRFAFDRKTGQLWVGQNGQDLWEQVYVVHRGKNYGWSIMEGGHAFNLTRKRGPTPITPPSFSIAFFPSMATTPWRSWAAPTSPASGSPTCSRRSSSGRA